MLKQFRKFEPNLEIRFAPQIIKFCLVNEQIKINKFSAYIENSNVYINCEMTKCLIHCNV